MEGYRDYRVYGCSDCHSANPVYGDVVSSASTVEGLLSAIRRVPEMNARYASTLALGAIKRQDIAAYIALVTGTPPPPVNYTGLWWASPPGSESGWGISFAHQGDVIFATWFTYDTTGKAWWLSMRAGKARTDTYAGTLYESHGPPFNAVPFDQSRVTRKAVGSATLTFTDLDTAQFAYTVNGVSQTRTLVREVFADPVSVCAFGIPILPWAVNAQGLWGAWPAGTESGWGLHLTEQGDVIFATWFTYDVDGTPTWLSGTAYLGSGFGGPHWTGTLYRTTGPPFSSVPFDPAQVVETPAGTFQLGHFSDNPAAAEFDFASNGSLPDGDVYRVITREVFVQPGTYCR